MSMAIKAMLDGGRRRKKGTTQGMDNFQKKNPLLYPPVATPANTPRYLPGYMPLPEATWEEMQKGPRKQDMLPLGGGRR